MRYMVFVHIQIPKVSVSKALNGKGGVSDELRRSILAAAHKMGYDRIRIITKQHPSEHHTSKR